MSGHYLITLALNECMYFTSNISMDEHSLNSTYRKVIYVQRSLRQLFYRVLLKANFVDLNFILNNPIGGQVDNYII